MRKLISRIFPQLILVTLVIVLFAANYKPGTYLLGWDSLSTEFNPTLGIKRAFFSVWQEYQSFGLVAGMAHAADLIRAVFIYLTSFVLPENLTRYFFHIFMLLLGTLGTFALLKNTLRTEYSRLVSFVGACFYLGNFFITQIFYLPFEPFSIFAAILPWNILMFFRILDKGFTLKNTLLLTFIFVLSTPAFIAQQVFVVLVLIFGALGLGKFIQVRSLNVIKRGFLFAIILFIVNAFWILPQAYFLHANGAVATTSKINQLSTIDVLFRNQDKGNIFDFARNIGFFYESTGLTQDQLFAPWKAFRENIAIQVILYALFGVTILGTFRKSSYRIPMVLSYLLIVLALLNYTPGIKELNDLIRTNSFINQVFRSPFTKFAVPAAVISSFFFTSGVILIAKFVSRFTKTQFVAFTAISTLFLGLICIQALPLFQGNLFSSEMKVSVPNDYKKLFAYFKTQDKNARIGILPEYTYWGWLYQKWGYNGSGFIWYGIEQPIVSRNFDMWSKNSENYFWEAKEALEGEDINAYNKVLQKYNISYVLLDESLAPVISSMKSIQYDRLKNMLSKNQKLERVQKWGNISVYKTKLNQKFVMHTTSLPNIGPELKSTNQDVIYQTHGNYKTDTSEAFQRYYPFIGFTTQTKNNDFEIHESSGSFTILKKLDPNIQDIKISTTSGEFIANFYIDNTPVEFLIPYSIYTSGNILVFQFPKVLIKDFNVVKDRSDYCKYNNGIVSYQNNKGRLLISAKNGVYGCVNYSLSIADQRYGYLISVGTRNIEGERLFFSVVDQTKNQPYIEDRLTKDQAYYVIADRFSQGLGYSLYFQASSLKSIPSQNDIAHLGAYIIPYHAIKTLYLENEKNTHSVRQKNASFKKDNYYIYTVKPSRDKTYNTVILNQSFDNGWKAYQNGKELKHILVNNWANGWETNDNNSNITIRFTPQNYQYTGFILFGGYLVVLGGIVLKKHIKRAN